MYLNVLPYRHILGTRVDITDYPGAVLAVTEWAKLRQSRYVCAANVHMVMEAYDDSHFRRIVNSADLVTSDGMPLVWTLRRMGIESATRVYGPDLMLHVCEVAQREGLPVAFYGGKPDYLNKLLANLLKRFSKLKIVFSYAPPFRDLSVSEDDSVVKQINASGARILFVGLGCPKQERWMLEHKGRVRAVMLGVGAAFDFYSERIRQAPRWVQRLGMEWCFRLFQDPQRLWLRYAKHNPRFVVLLIKQFLAARRALKGRVSSKSFL